MAIAPTTRWRIPPLIWCGNAAHPARPAAGMRHHAEQLHAALPDETSTTGCMSPLNVSDQLVAYGQHRIQRGHRVLQNHADVAARECPTSRPLSFSSRSSPSNMTLPPTILPPGSGTRRISDSDGHALARAGFAYDTQRLAALEVEGNPIDRLDHAGSGEEVRLKIFALPSSVSEFTVVPRVLHAPAAWGRACRAASPRRS